MATIVDLANATREAFIEDMPIDVHMKAHPIMDVLWRQKMRQSGSMTLDFRTIVDQPGQMLTYEGRTIPTPAKNDIIKNCSLPWKKAIYEMEVEGDTSFKNKSDSQIVDLFRETMNAGIAGITESLSYRFFNDTGVAYNPVGPVLAEFHGLPAVFDTSYAGLTDAGEPKWAPVRVDAESAPITRDMLDDAITRLVERKAKPQVIIASRRQWVAISKFIDQKTVYNDPGKESRIELGRPPRQFYSGTEVILDHNCPDAVIYILDLRKFHLGVTDDPRRTFQLSPWKFLDPSTDKQDLFLSTALFAGNFLCRNRHQQGRISNLTV